MDDFKISIQQIEIFLTVAKCKSISAAAQKLYLSQPAVSKLMHEMEWILGKQLFVRSNRGITLSPDGELIYARLHNTYHKFRVTLEHIMLEDSPYKNINMLNVGCLNDPGAISSMYAFVNLLKKRQPELQTASEIYSFQELKEKLLFGELDMFFSFSGNEDSEDFESFQLYDVERLFWLPAEWPTPLEKPQDLHFLKDKTLLLEIHNECDKAVSACRAHGFEPKEIKYVGTFLLLSYLISTGEGFTIWSRYLPEVFRQRIRIVPFMIDKGVPPTSIFATWRKNDSSEKLAKALTAIRDPSLREPEKDPLGKGFGSRW